MAGALLRSVHVGRPVRHDWAGKTGWTSIAKARVDGPVHADRYGLDGDEVADTVHHGGVDQAVYAYAREDLDWWESELGVPLADGVFGENLTTDGIDLNGVRIGERWQIGEVILEVAAVRIPCAVFQGWMGRVGADATAWVRRFTGAARPGPYLRVLRPGRLGAGDPVEVVETPGHDVTVETMFLALTTRRELLPRLLDVGPSLHEPARARAEGFLLERRG